MVSYDPADPLSKLIAPPANETSENRKAREAKEARARKVSQMIDEQLKAEKSLLKKKKLAVKVLVLGQSESGKSTTIKNFQLAYAHQAWVNERLSWRCVIYLNLIRSVNRILEALNVEMMKQFPPSQPPSPIYSFHSQQFPLPLSRISRETFETEPSDDDTLVDQPPLLFSNTHKLLKLRLAPLLPVQRDLEAQIEASASEVEGSDGSYSPTDGVPFAHMEHAVGRISRSNEFYVRSNCGWKHTLNKLCPRLSLTSPHQHRVTNRKLTEVMGIISGSATDIKSLWTDAVVQAVLKRRHIRLEESSGFFLDDVDRIASRNYEPSDDDVLRARLRTVGVQEHRFIIEKGSELGREWLMFDVGGTRTSRAAWFPFFDDIHAIIFMAPISCFDENLEEDSKVNRVKDSLLLWKAICSSKLLEKVQFVLFLNKCDLLARKLRQGLSLVSEFFPQFGDRSQDINTVGAWFRHEFKKIHKHHRHDTPFFSHMTSVTNLKTTAATLRAVRDGIVQSTLASADFM